MLRGHDNRTVPVVARQHHQVIVEMQRLGRDSKIGIPLRDRFGDLRRRPLMHMQRDARVAFDKALNHARQRVARLGMSGRYVQRSLIGPRVLARH